MTKTIEEASAFISGSPEEGFERGFSWDNTAMQRYNSLAKNIGEAVGVALRETYGSTERHYPMLVDEAIDALIVEEPPLEALPAANFARGVYKSAFGIKRLEEVTA